jgi:hypothetical protein
MIENFIVAKYQFICTAGAKGLELPIYKGSTLRGSFGQAFRKLVCPQPQQKACISCILITTCPYGYIFETAPMEGSEKLRNYESIPRPFVLEPPLEEKRVYQEGDSLSFQLVLIGKAINYLPYFILTFQEVGRIGIGKGKKPFSLMAVKALSPLTGLEKVVYSQEQSKIEKADNIINGTELLNQDSGRRKLKLNFLTMTRVKFADNFADKLEFHILLRNLLRRISTTSYFHQGKELTVDYQQLINKAETVKLVEDNLRWVDWERYSSRQDTKINLGGLVGEVVYEGDLAEFMPLIRLGELIHVGKGTVFGMGQYKIQG